MSYISQTIFFWEYVNSFSTIIYKLNHKICCPQNVSFVQTFSVCLFTHFNWCCLFWIPMNFFKQHNTITKNMYKINLKKITPFLFQWRNLNLSLLLFTQSGKLKTWRAFLMLPFLLSFTQPSSLLLRQRRRIPCSLSLTHQHICLEKAPNTYARIQ